MSTTSERIVQGLGPPEAIAQAVSILMAKHHVSEETALDVLVRVASQTHANVRETASRIVAASRRS